MDSCQGTTSQAAEKLFCERVLKGRGFSRADCCCKTGGFSRRGKCFSHKNFPQRLKPGELRLVRRGCKPRPFKPQPNLVFQEPVQSCRKRVENPGL